MVVARSKTDPFFKEVLLGALNVYRGKAPRTYHTETVAEQSAQVFVLEKKYLFLSEQEFQDRFGVRASQVPQLQLQTYNNETGVVCIDPNKPFRRLRVCHRVSLEHSTMLLQPQDQLRKDQGADLYGYYAPSWSRNNSLGQANNIPTLQQLTLFAEEAKAKANGTAAAAEPEETPPEKPPLAGQETNLDDVEEIFVCPSLPAAKGKGKSKGKGKNKSQQLPSSGAGTGGKKRRASTASSIAGSVGHDDELDSPPGTADGRSRAASVAGETEAGRPRSRSPVLSTRGLPRSPVDKLSSKVEHHMRPLSVAKVLDGVNPGREIYQASRALEALEKGSPGSSESVTLRARLKLVKQAQDITAEKLFSIKGPQRIDLISKVLPHMREKVPARWSAAFLTAQVKDTFITNELAVEKLLAMLTPAGDEGAGATLSIHTHTHHKNVPGWVRHQT